MRGVAVTAGLAFAGLLGIVFWAALSPDPMGGEPVAIVQIDAAPAVQTAEKGSEFGGMTATAASLKPSQLPFRGMRNRYSMPSMIKGAVVEGNGQQ